MPAGLRYLHLLLSLAAVTVAGCSSSNAGKAEDNERGASSTGGAATVDGLGSPAGIVADTATVVVYKNPTCECCERWADHLGERPAVAGIAVPGMPRGVPGMDGPVKDRYDVIAFRRDGTSSVYASR